MESINALTISEKDGVYSIFHRKFPADSVKVTFSGEPEGSTRTFTLEELKYEVTVLLESMGDGSTDLSPLPKPLPKPDYVAHRHQIYDYVMENGLFDITFDVKWARGDIPVEAFAMLKQQTKTMFIFTDEILNAKNEKQIDQIMERGIIAKYLVNCSQVKENLCDKIFEKIASQGITDRVERCRKCPLYKWCVYPGGLGAEITRNLYDLYNSHESGNYDKLRLVAEQLKTLAGEFDSICTQVEAEW